MRVLVVSPDAGFGGLIQQTLDNAGDYEPVLVINGRQALELATKLPFDLAILDTDLAGFAPVELGLALQTLSPDIRLILIPTEGTTRDFAESSLRICGYLSKPFYLPDLLETVRQACKAQAAEAFDFSPVQNGEFPAVPGIEGPGSQAETKPAAPKTSGAFAWAEDATRAAQHLARLSLASASQATLLLRKGELWAYAGQLSQPAVAELAQVVLRDRGRISPGAPGQEGSSGLARYVRLKATGDDYMLYTTRLDEDRLLVLTFDTGTPISKVRAQVGELVRALTTNSDLETIAPLAAQEGDRSRLDSTAKPDRLPQSSETAPAEPEGLPDQPDAATPPLLPLEDVPPPTPPGYQGPLPHFEQIHWPWEFEPEMEEENPPPAGDGEAWARGSSQPPGWAGGFEQPGKARGTERWILRDAMSAEEYLSSLPEELRPATSSVILSSPVVYVIHYACVLVPRLPEHHLQGDLATQLSSWMHRLSLAFGWRLEYVAVHPDYLHWISAVLPETSASEVIQLVRQRTTEMIFTIFPITKKENPCDDFWAPGYLVVTGSHPLPADLVGEYIEQTRLRQGIAGKVE